MPCPRGWQPSAIQATESTNQSDNTSGNLSEGVNKLGPPHLFSALHFSFQNQLWRSTDGGLPDIPRYSFHSPLSDAHMLSGVIRCDANITTNSSGPLRNQTPGLGGFTLVQGRNSSKQAMCDRIRLSLGDYVVSALSSLGHLIPIINTILWNFPPLPCRRRNILYKSLVV